MTANIGMFDNDDLSASGLWSVSDGCAGVASLGRCQAAVNGLLEGRARPGGSD